MLGGGSGPLTSAGPGGGGKSYLALQMQASAALGIPWLGLCLPQCPSLGLYSEDRFEAVANRLHLIARHYRTSVAERRIQTGPLSTFGKVLGSPLPSLTSPGGPGSWEAPTVVGRKAKGATDVPTY